MIIFIGVLTFVSTLIGGFLAVRFKDKLHLILGFSAGAVLGVALFDLLPETISLAENINTGIITLLIAGGFVLYMILDRLFSIHGECSGEVCPKPLHRGTLSAATLCFHSFLDGLGIGLSFKISPSVGWIVTAAVLAHDFSDGLNTVNLVLRSGGQKKQAFRWLLIDSFTPIIGIIISQFLSVSSVLLGLMLAVFTGFFLFIGASDLVPESHHRHPSRWTTGLTVLGMSLIYLAVKIAG